MSSTMTGAKKARESKTIWAGVLAFVSALCGVMVSNWAPLEGALTEAGVSPESIETAFQVLGGVSALLAIWGRKVARHVIMAFLLCLVPFQMVGCGVGAGAAARETALAPEIVAAWGDVMDDALYGIDAKVRDGVYTPALAKSRYLTVELFDQGVQRLGE